AASQRLRGKVAQETRVNKREVAPEEEVELGAGPRQAAVDTTQRPAARQLVGQEADVATESRAYAVRFEDLEAGRLTHHRDGTADAFEQADLAREHRFIAHQQGRFGSTHTPAQSARQHKSRDRKQT